MCICVALTAHNREPGGVAWGELVDVRRIVVCRIYIYMHENSRIQGSGQRTTASSQQRQRLRGRGAKQSDEGNNVERVCVTRIRIMCSLLAI